MPDNSPKIERALLSVSDKSGIETLASGLVDLGATLISTGGTARQLKEAGLPVTDVAEVTDFPEMMDGRLKTLHPKVHGGLLALRDNDDHRQAQEAHGIANIDLLVVNLYPFEATVESGADFATCVENIDIGGPAMIRAGAKNHPSVTVVVDPGDYDRVLDEIKANGGATSDGLRRELAAKAYARTAAYDAAISGWFATEIGDDTPQILTTSGTLVETLRYGENPHQSAAFYRNAEARPGVATARQAQGKALSFNNLNDTDAAYELVAEFDPATSAAVAIIKHANPCGVATGATHAEAYAKALICDPVSAFGGIVALNGPLDAEAATEIAKIFTEVVIAPDASDEALEILGGKKDLRVLLAGGLPDPRAPGMTLRTLAGGLLVQGRDNGVVDDLDLKVVTKREPSAQELEDLKFAFRVCKHVKSNAIVYAKNGATVGVGAGQMSRIDSARIAAWKSDAAAKEAGESEP
ncbi:MAG: bifunctional phosphoribosylaminoimidazolecarboxamide formyltransferase/IMP cyclohydrolase, partial [Methyloligellaceae bacterium]